MQPWDEPEARRRRPPTPASRRCTPDSSTTPTTEIGPAVRRALDRLGRLDDTIVVVVSDNGASQEGGTHGVLDTTHYENGHFPELDEVVARMDEIDGRTAHVNYPLGWAQAGNTPLRRYKQNVHAGGIRTSMIMRLPASVIDRQLAGEKRDHFQHVTDIVPTILDLVEVEAPAVRRGMHAVAIRRP